MTLRGFSWVLPGELAGMPMPMQTDADAAELKALGIGAVVNLSSRAWPAGVLERAGLRSLHLPILDFAPPTPEDVDRFVEFCDAALAEGRAVVVHCIAGRGRTGTMLACYLVHRGRGAAKAIRLVRAARPGSLETPEQERAVQEYAARCRQRG